MTAKELANLLNGREYGKEITKEEIKIAEESGLVIVFGASDDLMEFLGAICDEVGCYSGEVIHLDENGVYPKFIESDVCENCDFFKAELAKKKSITATWCGGDGYLWTYCTDIPHETFDILEDGEKYCWGIVLNIEDLKPSEKYPEEDKSRCFNIMRGIVVSSYLRAMDKEKLINFITYLEEGK